MELPPTDPIQKHVFDQLTPHRGNMLAGTFTAMTSNIAFLIKNYAGIDVEPKAVAVSVIHFLEADPDGSAHTCRMERMAICVQDDSPGLNIIVKAEVNTTYSWIDTVYALEKKVNKAVKTIQDNEGGEGLGN